MTYGQRTPTFRDTHLNDFNDWKRPLRNSLARLSRPANDFKGPFVFIFKFKFTFSFRFLIITKQLKAAHYLQCTKLLRSDDRGFFLSARLTEHRVSDLIIW